MKKRSHNIALLLLLLFYTHIIGQESKLEFQALSQELSNNFVRDIYKDSHGFMWFGTYNGLNKYDGTNITIFQHKQGDSLSLISNSINAITEDRNSKLWIGTSEGLNYYDRGQNKFVNPNNINGIKSKLIFLSVTSLYSAKNGELYIGTLGGGLSVYNEKELEFKSYFFSEPNNKGGDRDYITCISKAEDGYIWVGTQKGLFLINEDNKLPTDFQAGNISTKLSSSNIIDIRSNNEGGFWIATSEFGLLFLEKNEDGKYKLKSINKWVDTKLINQLSIRSICSQGNNKVWIGTEDGGVIYLDGDKNKTYSYLPDEGNAHSISSNSIWSIYIDESERVWMGTYNKGVCVYDKKYSKFESYQRNPFVKNSLSDNDVTCFANDKNGNIWIGSDGGGIDVFNAKNKSFIENIDLPNQAIKCIIRDEHNSFWIGTWGNGVEKVDINRKLSNYLVKANGIGDNKILCLYEDNSKNIWAGSAGSGLFLYNKNNSKFEQKLENEGEIGIPSYAFVSAIHEDVSGNLWIGTLYGLYRFTKNKNGEIDSKAFFSEDKDGSISSNRIQTILETKNGELWFGTFENGLNLYHKETNSFTSFNKTDGLISDLVMGLVEGSDNNLWVFSDKGINKFNYQNKSSQVFNTVDGLLSNTIYLNANLITNNGEIYVGTDKGFNIFHPDSIHENKEKPLMYLTGLLVNNKQTKVAEQNSVLSKHIGSTKQIQLNYRQTSFTIDYVGVSYTRSQDNIYKYKLSKLSDDWNFVGSNTSVSFTGLRAGHYHFEVLGANNDGYWSDIPASLDIIIKPPFWKTWWAYFIYIFSVLFLAIYVFRNRIEKIHALNTLKFERLEREKEQELNQYKMQFFTNISHEFRTPLSLIIAPLESLLSSKGEKKNRNKLSIAYNNTKRLMHLVDELMDFRKIENKKMKLSIQYGDYSAFVQHIMSTFNEVAQTNNISYTFDSPSSPIEAWFDMNSQEKILVNLLSNSFKHTPINGEISVKVSNSTHKTKGAEKQNFIQIAVINSGPGIDAKDLPHIFDRFYQSKGNNGGGSGIGLALVKSLVELHHGSIEASSSLNKFTKFQFSFPIDKNAYTEDEIIANPLDIIEITPEYIPDNYKTTTEEKESLNNKSKPELLIVEDNEELRNYIFGELSTNYKVLMAEDGEKGLEIALNNTPDLIVSDVLMPKMNGVELCEKLKKDIKTSHIPIILLTAKTTINDQVTGLEHGADVYITKPFSAVFLKAQINRLIENREALYKLFSQEVYITPAQVTNNKLDEEFLQKIIDLITDNLLDSQYSVENIADSLNLSRSQFYKKTKAITGQSAVEFLRSVKLKHAVKLMETGRLSLAEIAYQSGFTSPSYFARSFKSYYGKSPSEFLKKQ